MEARTSSLQNSPKFEKADLEGNIILTHKSRGTRFPSLPANIIQRWASVSIFSLLALESYGQNEWFSILRRFRIIERTPAWNGWEVVVVVGGDWVRASSLGVCLGSSEDHRRRKWCLAAFLSFWFCEFLVASWWIVVYPCLAGTLSLSLSIPFLNEGMNGWLDRRIDWVLVVWFQPMKFGWKIVVGSVVGFFGAAFGSVGGVGGGGIFVPMLSLIVGFDPKTSTAISKCKLLLFFPLISFWHL